MVTDKEPIDILKGTALDVYQLMLRSRKPFGIREIQRALKLSSPSLAQHYLFRLESVGLVKRQNGCYLINKVLLENSIKIGRVIIPRYFSYCLLAVVSLALELVFIKPPILFHECFLPVIPSIVFLYIFTYEAVKIQVSRRI